MMINNLLYLFQQENYDRKRFLKFSYTKLNWFKSPQRKKLDFTPKIILIFSLTIFICVLVAFILFKLKPAFTLALLLVAILYFILPLIIILSSIIIFPLEYFLKNRKIKKAQQKIQNSQAVVVGITGSYGKTSTKEILHTILSGHFKTIKTPDSINTEIGISDFILANDLSDQEVIIIEMGAHHQGEIAQICEIVKPTYSITCGINESHLERFGSLENIIRTKFELAERTEKISWLNFEDRNIADNYDKFTINDSRKTSSHDIEYDFLENYQGIKFTIQQNSFTTKLIAKHSLIQIKQAIELAIELGMNWEEIKSRVIAIAPAKHRLELIHNHQTGVTIIDDSYNGNFDGFVSGIEVLKRARGRKIVLTPGIIELGELNQKIHNQVGKLYSENVDLVLLVENKATIHIKKALDELKFDKYKVYNSAREAHEDLKNILLKNDTIIFQNDWPDNL
jgi:UDP-N-acetylmuramoyl-tripeptide--D-alanyl-D-alanine ligase